MDHLRLLQLHELAGGRGRAEDAGGPPILRGFTVLGGCAVFFG